MNAFKKFIITGLGTGLMPFMPGTWGSAAVCVIFLAVAGVCGSAVYAMAAMAIVSGVSSAACLLLGKWAEKAFDRKDPLQCTVDEFAGQAITLILLPAGANFAQWAIITNVGFVAFRFFDIVKPFPIRRLEKLPYGTGVLLDDLLAGIYANIACQLFLRFVLHYG